MEEESVTSFIAADIYRRLNSDIYGFNSLFEEILENFQITQKPYYLLGDVNINITTYNVHQNIQEYVDNFNNHSFLFLNSSTRVTHQSASLTDLI